MAQHPMTFSPAVSSSSHHRSQCSFAESGYVSGFSVSSRPFGDFSDAAATTTNQSLRFVPSLTVSATPSVGESQHQTTPRTTAAINYISSLQLSTPRLGLRRKGTPLKRHQGQSIASTHSIIYETTPKKAKSQENIENDLSFVPIGHSLAKMPFQARLDISSPRHPLALSEHSDKLDCTFDAISSSTPIGKPFRADLYEQQLEEIPLKNLTRSGGKNTRTKIIRKMQSFSPRKLMGMRVAKIPLQEMDQNSVDFQFFAHTGLCPVAEEESPIPKVNSGAAVKKSLFTSEIAGGGCAPGLRDLIFGDIKMDADIPVSTTSDQAPAAQESSTHNHLETSSQLLDLYVTNLSNLDGGADSNSKPATEDGAGDVSMNNSLVIQYFDELKRNTTQVQERQPDGAFEELKPKDSWEFNGADLAFLDAVTATEVAEMEIVQGNNTECASSPRKDPPMLRKRKRPSAELLIQGVLATPKKMRRSQSFHLGDHLGAMPVDENMAASNVSDGSQVLSPGLHRLGGARKRLNYEPIARNRYSPAKRHLTFEGRAKRRSLVGIAKLNIFRHLANCPPVRDYFFEFVEDRDLATIYAVSRQCKAMIEEHPKLNARRRTYLDMAMRKKENNSIAQTTTMSISEDSEQRIQGSICERSLRMPLNNRNVDTSRHSGMNESQASPLVSPSKRKFHENQKAVQQHPRAVFMHCPRCRSSSIIEEANLSQSGVSNGDQTVDTVDEMDGRRSFTSRSLRSYSMCYSDLETRRSPSSRLPVRKQQSLPETSGIKFPAAENGRMAVCQSTQCGFKFCVHCRYAFGADHKCVEIGTLSPLIKQSRQPRVVACSRQSKRNLKRL